MAGRNQSDSDPKAAASCSGASAGMNPGVSADVPAVPCLIPTFSDACKLVSAPYSCLVLHSHRRHVALPPMYLKKKRTGIQEELNAELLKYSSSLKGVPLAYDDIKVIGQHGNILDDHGYIHIDIQASFVLFKPRNGEKLVGVINKIGTGHVGCLVHGCFNASVVKPAQLTPEQWRDSGLKVGGSLEFEVFQLDADVAGVLLIRGRLERSRVQELVASFSSTETEEQSEDLVMEAVTEPDSVPTEESLESAAVSEPHKKKKKKKSRGFDEVAEDANGSQTDEIVSHGGNGMAVDSNSNVHPREKKKKKKKKDKRQEEDEELPSPTADLPNSGSSGYVSDKVNKRPAPDDHGLREDVYIPPSKKKRKIK